MESIRIAVVGGGVGGKSTFVLHYITGVFDPNVGPMWEEEYKKTIQIPDFDLVDANSPTVKLEILDTPGQEEYSAMRDQYMRDSHGFIVLYSVTSKATFEEAPTFIGQILRVKEAEHGEVPIILLANKMDEPSNQMQVTSEEGMKYAVDCKIPFIEASAKTGQNIANAFIDLSKLIIENRKKKEAEKTSPNRPKRKSLLPKRKEPAHFDYTNISTYVPPYRIFNREINYHKQPPRIETPSSTYFKDMSLLREEADFADVTFSAPNSDSKDLFRAHKFIIASRCGHLMSMIEVHEKSENPQDPVPIPFTSFTFNLFLEYMYTAEVSIDERFPPLLVLAKAWSVPDLTLHLTTGKYSPKPHKEANEAMAISSHRTRKSIILNNAESRPVKAVPPKEKFKSDFNRALNSNDNSYDHRFDVKFIIKDEPGKSIFAHKAILVQRCPYFRAMFTGGMKEKSEFEIEMSDFSFVALLTAIEYCYTDEVRFSEDTAVDLLITASKLGMERLKTAVAAYIAQGMCLDNLVEMYRLATIATSAPLCEYCSFFIIRTLSKLESSKEFTEVLTKEEIDSFTDKRQHWLEGVQVVDERVNKAIEQYWLAKLREDENVHVTSKKCIIM